MYDPTILPDIHNVTSSPASACGHMPCGAQGGATIVPSGPVRARVNRGVMPEQCGEETKGRTMPVISGRSGVVTSRKDDLKSSLVSKFQVVLQCRGLTDFSTTWSETITPFGRSLPKLRLSDHRKGASGSILLPTLTAREGKDRSRPRILAKLDRGDGVAKRICARSVIARSVTEPVGLNPSFAAWMMGLPSVWNDCTPSVTQCMRPQRKPSSKR